MWYSTPGPSLGPTTRAGALFSHPKSRGVRHRGCRVGLACDRPSLVSRSVSLLGGDNYFRPPSQVGDSQLLDIRRRNKICWLRELATLRLFVGILEPGRNG